MKDFEKGILNKLLDKYENSKLSKEGTSTKRSIKLTTKDAELSTYNGFDSFKYVEVNDNVIKNLEKQNFVTACFENDSFKYLTLNLNNVDAVYNYLGRNKPSDELNRIKDILTKYHFDNFVNSFKEFTLNYIDTKYTYPKLYFGDAEQLDLILNIFTKMFELTEDIKIRDFSSKYLGDSKLFESMQGKIIKIIKDFDENEHNEDDVLSDYYIVKNSSYALIKNNLIFKINNSIINLNDFGYEFSLSDEMIKSLSLIESNVNKIITVENLTSFYSLNEKDSVIVYLAGFHNHTKQSLLLKIYEKYPHAEYYHFGDIDVGGILIFYNLIDKTKIPFKPYQMGINELENNLEHTKKLTENDVKSLNRMINDSKYLLFNETIKYMLKNNIKLEQETLD